MRTKSGGVPSWTPARKLRIARLQAKRVSSWPCERIGNLEAVAFKRVEQVFQVVDIWEALAAVDENRLDGLLGGLLCVEAMSSR